MSNAKTRKFHVQNREHQPKNFSALVEQDNVAILSQSPVIVKQISHAEKEPKPAAVKRDAYIIHEIKRSVVCGAITFGILLLLYFIFK